MIPPLRWRDLLPGLLSYFAKPIGWVALALAVGVLAGRCGRPSDRDVIWEHDRKLAVGPLWSAFERAQADSAARVSRLVVIADSLRHVSDSLAQRLSRPAPHAPPPVPAEADSASYALGYDEGYNTGWTDAADAATGALTTQRAAYDTLTRVAVMRETARLAALTEADTLRQLLAAAPKPARPPRLTCGVGLAYTAPIDGAAGLHPALTLGCHIPLLRF